MAFASKDIGNTKIIINFNLWSQKKESTNSCLVHGIFLNTFYSFSEHAQKCRKRGPVIDAMLQMRIWEGGKEESPSLSSTVEKHEEGLGRRRSLCVCKAQAPTLGAIPLPYQTLPKDRQEVLRCLWPLGLKVKFHGCRVSLPSRNDLPQKFSQQDIGSMPFP